MRIIQAVAVIGLIAAPMTLAACDTNEGPFEEAGEELDEAADDVEDAVN